MRPLVFALLALIGCAPNWADPVLRVESIQVADMNVLGTTLDIQLSAYNPNSEPLPFEEVEYEIRIGDSRPLSGHAVFDVPLPAMETTPLATTVHVPSMSAISIVQELSAGNASYRLDGVMTLVYRGRRHVAFEREGLLRDVMTGGPTN